jgi:GTP-binding protein
MRREGFELSVSKPEIIIRVIDGIVHEAYEKVIVNVPDEFLGSIIPQFNSRKGVMVNMSSDSGYTVLEYLIPTRGLIGYRSEFINTTKGQGSMEKSFDSYKPYAGDIDGRKNGVFIAKEAGKAMAYSLFNLSDRGQMIINPGEEVYAGMIVGIHSRSNDLVVNPCKNKNLTNTRSSSSDEAIKLLEPLKFTLEEALEVIEYDELVEITPKDIRLRKKILDENDRKRAFRAANKS